MPNHLSGQTSPYLLQHADNPVDWWPWCDEALEISREQDKPILLSIGYSSCHWCHVMERESFEDPDTAAAMNRDFVCIKVDREERPDIDAIYMEAVQAMTGQGGWPLTVFLDPGGTPFFGGTYFPPSPRHGLPSFSQVLQSVVEAYRERRDEIEQSVGPIKESLGASAALGGDPSELPRSLVERAEVGLLQRADRRNGGFGGAPKFPPACALGFLIGRDETEISGLTLDAMRCGGIFDQVGGGFARYSVDARWLIPHFEKMLYDNALLASCYLQGWKLTGQERWLETARETLDWALREMRGAEGGFYAALDADSEGEEGRFYVWGESEIRGVLTSGGIPESEIEQVLGYWGVSAAGNFEGSNVLHVAAGASATPPQALDEARRLLLAARETRVRPGLDDKRICSWNALMVSALAAVGAACEDSPYLQAALDCAEFIWTEMRDESSDGDLRLLRTWKDGAASLNGYLEDYAFTLQAFLDLHEATLDPTWFDRARQIADSMRGRFEDSELGGFFTTSHDHEALLVRRKDFGDHPIPAAGAMAAMGLLRLSLLTGEVDYRDSALKAISPLSGIASENPDGFGYLLQVIDLASVPSPRQVALIRPETGSESAAESEISRVIWSSHLPNTVVGGGVEGGDSPPLIAGKPAIESSATAYVCEDFHCESPTVDPEELRGILDG